jgi:hypothetical protein
MNTERGGPGGCFWEKRDSTLNAATFWYHREKAEGAMRTGVKMTGAGKKTKKGSTRKSATHCTV